jgi:toxin ParE1/3/4
MAYLVNVTARAQRDLAFLFEAINAQDSDAALRWYRGLTEAILSREEKPHRCPATPENRTLRHLLYGRKPHIYRVIFKAREKPREVDILHIRHSARPGFKPSELR